MGRTPALIGLALLAACGSSHPAATDAAKPVDAGPDADLVDYNVTARYLDWDSTTSHPCPIVGAKWYADLDVSRVAFTDDTGTFAIRLASYLWYLDVEQPADTSACATPSSSYTIGAHALITPAVFYAGGHFVMRSLTDARAASYSLDPSRGSLYVHVDGAPRAVSIDSASDPAQAFDGSTWSPGNSGSDVFFPNVDLGTSTMPTVSVEGGAMGTGSVPLVAGTITYMTVVPN